MDALDCSQFTSAHIKQWTRRDRILSKVMDFVLHGWQTTDDSDFKLFQQRQEELSVHGGCLLWGNRVVVPPVGRRQA